MPATMALGLMLLFAFAQTAAAQNAGAADPPLKFGTNYFVTGDYVVAGAYGMTTNFTNVNGTTYALGTINVPDLKNPFTNAVNTGNTGATSVPAGAQIVAAVLYWQTVEKIGVTPGGPGSGQIGFFRRVFQGGSQTGYILNGVDLQSQNAVSFSAGGCTGGSTGKAVRTYRADVRGYLPVDPATGNVLANGKYEVMLPSTSSTTPITLGATLVIIYRVLSSPDPLNPAFVPLNSIVIYDGVYAPGGTLLNMTQTVQGFYQASANPVSRLTHIVGQGKSKKMETVSLNGIAHNIARPPVPLPSLYPGQPPFPGFYGSWDNPTWTFPYSSPNPPPANYPSNPLQENDDSATTMVAPTSSQQGCVSWGAVIVSTRVHDDDEDGILQVWKQNQGYTDVGTGQFVSLADPADPINMNHPRQDVFIQMDHVVALDANGNLVPNGDFTPDPLAVSAVHDAFLANGHGVHLHINTGSAGAHAIPEPVVTDGSASCNGGLCPYPNQPGITAWRDGFEFVENQPLNYTQEPTAQLNEADCEANSPPLVPISGTNCIRRFPPQLRNSHHYVVFGDTLGAANWGLFGGTLTDSTGKGAGVVIQFNNVVTFYTSRGHGLTPDPNNTHVPNGRVTIEGAISNPKLNGTYLVQSITCQVNPDPASPNFNQQDCSVSNKALGPYSFTIQLASAGTPPPTVCPKNTPVGSSCYTIQTDPRLSIASGQAGSGSGFSDVGGAKTLVTLGSWPLAYQTVPAKAGTFMHELGHTLSLLHGGGDNTNCKSNYQSVMNYMFQTKLLGPSGVLDFSSQQLNPLDETALGPITTMGAMPPKIAFLTTRWYDTKQTFVLDRNGNKRPVGTVATQHCNGTPLSIADPPTYGYKGGTNPLPSEIAIPWSTLNMQNSFLDANFEGGTKGSESAFLGYNDWANTDPRQLGAAGNDFFGGPGGGFVPGGPGGGFVPGGPGGGFVPGGPGGGFVPGGPGGGFVPGGPGGGFVPGGPGASVELDVATAVSVTDPPSNLTASEDVSPRNIHLSWIPATFPQMEKFNIYRSSDNGATFSFLTSVPAPLLPPSGTPPPVMYTDIVTCNPIGYAYFVTGVLLNTTVTPPQEQESTPTNTAPSSGPKLTGCYTNTPPTVALNDLAFIDLSSQNTPVQGDQIQITWSLKTDDTGVFVPKTAANTALLAIGPIPSDAQCAQLPKPPAVLGFNGTYPYPTADLTAGIGLAGNGFAVTWDTTNFNAGCYFFELDTDSKQSETSAVLTLLIFVSDSNPHITTTTLPNATAGVLYSNTVFESGGTVNNTTAFQWTIVPNSVTLNGFSVPSIGGISFQPNAIGITNGTLSGTATTVGTYIFTAKVTDSVGNTGMRALMLTVVAPVAQVNQPVAPENARPSASGFTLTVNGTGFYAGSSVLWNGSARATTFNNVNQLTATIPSADVAGFGTASISVANTGSPTSNVDFFQITNPTTGVSLGRVDYATGAAPGGLITGDFNGDGKLDLATANTTSNTVSVLLGNGDGTFAAASTFAVGSDPFNLVAGDFNNDGKLDLAVANFAGGATSNISILLGNGDGTFQTPGPTFAAGKGPISVVTGDFNRDGKLDLAVANRLDNTVSILLGNGDGTFQPHADYVASTQDVAGLAVGDFNGDGKLDLAVTNPSTGQVSILLGNGDGTFQAPVAYSTGASGDHPTAVTVADFNGDGILDLAVTKFNAKNVAIFLGKGDGTFQPEVSYATTSGAMVGPGGITTGDFNGDGLVDLVVTDQYDNTVSILLGNGNGTFQGPLEFATGNLSAGVAAGDFNGDGRLDVAVANDGASTVSVMLQPQVLLVPSALPFGSVAEGASTPSAVSLTNNGPGALTINSFAFGGTNPGDFSQTNYCPTSPSTLAGGLTCTITVTFAPTATGARSGTLIVTYPGTGSPQTVNLSGSGFVAAPANLTANAVAGSGSVSLAWSASPSASGGYNVYRSTTSGAYTSANKIASGVATTSYTDTVATGTTYYYVVTAVDGSGNESAFSNEASATP